MTDMVLKEVFRRKFYCSILFLTSPHPFFVQLLVNGKGLWFALM